MRDQKIKEAIGFLQVASDKNVSINQQKEMMKQKGLTDEEITEAYKQFTEKSTGGSKESGAVARIK